MDFRMAEELEAVGLGPEKSLFVAKDDAGGIFLELASSVPGTVYSWV